MKTKSTFNVLFIIQKGKLRPNGNAPIIGRITVNGLMAHFSTRLDTPVERWATGEGRTLGKTHEEKSINTTLDDFRSLAKTHYNALVVGGESVSAERIKNMIFNKPNEEQKAKQQPEARPIMLMELFDRFNEDYRQLVDKGTTYKTYSRYLLIRKHLAGFLQDKLGKEDIPVTEVNHNFINDFFIYLRTGDDNGHNYHIKFIQRFRTVYNVARNNGWVNIDPFANFKMSFEKTDRGFLTRRELDIIVHKKMPSKRLELVRDLFVFSCYTGISYIDLKELRKNEIVTGDDGKLWIDTERIKTGVQVKVPLLEIPLAILEKYADTSSRERLLDIPSNQKVNDYLKEIAAICGIDKPITFHLSRHTFATTVTLSNGVPLETVSKMLGHTNIRTTQIYARIIPQKISDDMSMLEQKLKSASVPASTAAVQAAGI